MKLLSKVIFKHDDDAVFMGGVMLGACLGGMLMLATGCPKQPEPAVPPPAILVAGSECIAFRTQKQLECVVSNRSKAEIDACRAGVQLAVDCTDGGLARFLVVKDGGAQ